MENTAGFLQVRDEILQLPTLCSFLQQGEGTQQTTERE
jgi:hypothetical protein